MAHLSTWHLKFQWLLQMCLPGGVDIQLMKAEGQLPSSECKVYSIVLTGASSHHAGVVHVLMTA